MWKTLAQDFSRTSRAQSRLRRFGIADSVFYADRIVIPYAPKQVVLYAGGNDLHGGKAPEQVIADFKAFVEKVRAKLPRRRSITSPSPEIRPLGGGGESENG